MALILLYYLPQKVRLINALRLTAKLGDRYHHFSSANCANLSSTVATK